MHEMQNRRVMKRILIAMDEQLLCEIDKQAQKEYMTRAEFFRHAARKYLDQARKDQVAYGG